MEVVRGSEGEEEEEEEWEEAEEGVEVDDVGAQDDEEEDRVSQELQQLAEQELGETEQVRICRSSSDILIFSQSQYWEIFSLGSNIRSGQAAQLAQVSGFWRKKMRNGNRKKTLSCGFLTLSEEALTCRVTSTTAERTATSFFAFWECRSTGWVDVTRFRMHFKRCNRASLLWSLE